MFPLAGVFYAYAGGSFSLWRWVAAIFHVHSLATHIIAVEGPINRECFAEFTWAAGEMG